MPGLRNLILVLGDQLDPQSAALEAMDPDQDVVWMAEVDQEATHVWCHKTRLVFFFSAMRHFRNSLLEKGVRVHYHEIRTLRSFMDSGRSRCRMAGTNRHLARRAGRAQAGLAKTIRR